MVVGFVCPLKAVRASYKAAHPGHGVPAADFLRFSESTLQRPGAFAPKAATPPQGLVTKLLFELVHHGVQLALFLPVLAVEEMALNLACVVLTCQL